MPDKGSESARHGLDEAPLLTASGERDPLVDDLEAGGTERLLAEAAYVCLDGDDVFWSQLPGTLDEIGHVAVESFVSHFGIGLESIRKTPLIAETRRLSRLVAPRRRFVEHSSTT